MKNEGRGPTMGEVGGEKRREQRGECGEVGGRSVGKDAHPLHPTAAQRSASVRLIQSDQVWTPSPINPGM